jgi:hypothetical protein
MRYSYLIGNNNKHQRLQVITALLLKFQVIWDVMRCHWARVLGVSKGRIVSMFRKKRRFTLKVMVA